MTIVICGSAIKGECGHPWRYVRRRRGKQVVVLGSRGAVKVPPRHSGKNGRKSGPLISFASIQGGQWAGECNLFTSKVLITI